MVFIKITTLSFYCNVRFLNKHIKKSNLKHRTLRQFWLASIDLILNKKYDYEHKIKKPF